MDLPYPLSLRPAGLLGWRMGIPAGMLAHSRSDEGCELGLLVSLPPQPCHVHRPQTTETPSPLFRPA